MKRIVSIAIILIAMTCIFAGVTTDSRTCVGYEALFSGFNYLPSTKPSFDDYTTKAISGNYIVENTNGVMFSDEIGLDISFALGYQRDLYDFNRFSAIPNNANGRATFGVRYLPVKSLELGLSGGLRTSYLFDKTRWVSQVGGYLSLGFKPIEVITLKVAAGYWFSTNYQSFSASFTCGYTFGEGRSR